MKPLLPWLIAAAAAVVIPGLMLGLRLISVARFAQLAAGLLVGLAIGFVAADPGESHG
jgi:hypothetical protein